LRDAVRAREKPVQVIEAAVLGVDHDDGLDAREAAALGRRAAHRAKKRKRKKNDSRSRAICVHLCPPGVMLARHLRAHRPPPHAPALAVVVVDREVLPAAVVPDRERARRPPPYLSAALFTPINPASSSRIAGDSASYAALVLAKSVSPPCAGVSSA